MKYLKKFENFNKLKDIYGSLNQDDRHEFDDWKSEFQRNNRSDLDFSEYIGKVLQTLPGGKIKDVRLSNSSDSSESKNDMIIIILDNGLRFEYYINEDQWFRDDQKRAEKNPNFENPVPIEETKNEECDNYILDLLFEITQKVNRRTKYN